MCQMNNMDSKIDSLIGDLRILDTPNRIMILDYLREKKGASIKLDEIYDKFSFMDKMTLKMHLRALNISHMIVNHEVDDEATYSITEKGETFLRMLENNPEGLLAIHKI